MMKSFIFWQRWLFYSSLLFALFGIVFAVYGNNPLFMPYNNALAHIFWMSDNIPDEIAPFKAFIWAPLGGTIACCYILLAFIAWFSFRGKRTLGTKCNYRSIWGLGRIGFGCLPLLWAIFSDIYH